MNYVMKKGVIALVFLMSILSVAEEVEAASWRTCGGEKRTWNGNSATMSLSTTSMPIGGTWDRETQYMMSEWTDVAGSNFEFKVGRDTNGSSAHRNNVNEVNFIYEPNESYIATTHYRYDYCFWFFGSIIGGEYEEMDIHFNTRWQWTTAPYRGWNAQPYNFQLTMLHELGHALGLLHQDGLLSIMNTRYPFGGPNGHFNQVEPHADDREGLKILYPDSSTEIDIAVSRFRNTGASVTANEVYTVIGGEAPTRSVAMGIQHSIEYTMENLGTQAEVIDIKFYISTNSYISSFDTYLGTTRWNVSAGRSMTFKQRITVPMSLPPGTYYVGYLVEINDATGTLIPDDTSDNNHVSLLNPITIY